MGLFNIKNSSSTATSKSGGGILQVIQVPLNMRDVLVWHYPSSDIPRGSAIIVRQTQRALIYSNGERIDNLRPGRHLADSNNIPGLESLLNVATGGETSYPFEVFFVDTSCEHKENFGITPDDSLKCKFVNPETGNAVDFGVLAHGSYRFKLYNPEIYCDKIVGTSEVNRRDDLANFFVDRFKVIVLDQIRKYIKENKVSLDLLLDEGPGNTLIKIREALNSELRDSYGIELTGFDIRFKSPQYDNYMAQSVEAMSEAARIREAGATYDKRRMYDIQEAAANNPGAGTFMGAGMGLGMGQMMGQMMSQMMAQSMAQSMGQQPMGQAIPNQNTQQAAPVTAPPPLPRQTKYHVVINGQSAGPYDIAALRPMVDNGTISHQTLVWTEGMPDWMQASTVAELAQLFSPVPPPIPPRQS